MPELGQILLKDGVISLTQLDEAVKTQVIFGGRLGTNLIELGYLDEQTLTKYLVKRHNVPTVDWHSISRIKPGLLKLFPKKLAQKYEAFPVKLDGNKLWVVMANPAHLGAISEMSFATGKAIKPLVLPEVRIFDLLQRFYQIGRELRYINVAMLYKEKAPPKKEDAKAQIGRIQDAQQNQLKDKIQAGATDELQSEEEFQKMAMRMSFPTETAEAPPRPAEAAPPPTEAIPPPSEKPAPPPAPARRPAPRLGPQPYKEVAQALYAILMKNGADQYVPKANLQEFLKIFVPSQLQARTLSLTHLAHWLIMESDAPIDWLEKTLLQFRVMESRLDITVYLPGEKLPELPQQAPPPAPAPAPPPAAAPPEAEEEVVEELVEVSDELTAEEAAAEAAPAPAEEGEVEEEEEIEKLSLAEAQQKLMKEVQDRADISRIVLGFARGYFVRSLLFTVRGWVLFGWDGRGGTLNHQLAESITLNLEQASLFKTVNDLKCHYLGPIQNTPTNAEFLKKLGGGKPNNAFLIPILVNEKVVYMLYGDNGHGQNVPFDIGELLILAQKIPPALDQLIRRKKQELMETA